jgi:hypothetical protein
MAVKAGQSPWSPNYENPFKDSFRRATKATMKKAGIEYSLSGGWRSRTMMDNWTGKPAAPKTKRIRLYSGRYVEVPDGDYEDFFGFHKAMPADPDSEIGKYIDDAKWTQRVEGVGHIIKMEYAPSRQLLAVTFETDGAEVVFFRVPNTAYSELEYLARDGGGSVDSKGVFRHNLGRRFWDIIRIRGVRNASRMRYEYLTTGISRGSSSSQEFDKEFEQDMASANSTVTSRKTLEKEYTDLYDGFAKMLGESARKEYNKLATMKEKANFLSEHGIL